MYYEPIIVPDTPKIKEPKPIKTPILEPLPEEWDIDPDIKVLPSPKGKLILIIFATITIK